MDHLMAGIEDLSGQKGHHLLRERQVYGPIQAYNSCRGMPVSAYIQ